MFGIYSGPLHELVNAQEAPFGERLRRLLLDSPLRPALRSGAAPRARVTPERAARARRHPPAVAGLAARPARGSEARDDREPGDRSLSRAVAVRTRSDLLRRSIRAAALGAHRGEPGDRAGGVGTGVRGH